MIKCITFDLDDTLWAIEPVIIEAEQRFYTWLKENYPIVAENFDILSLRQLMKNTASDNPDIKHNLTKVRIRAYTYIKDLYKLSDDMPLKSFEYFMKYRNKLKGKIIIARSLVLQGTLLSTKINFKFKKQITNFRKYINTISCENKISKEELIYRYVFSLKNLDYALIGSINKDNIKKILNYKKKGSLNNKLINKLNEISAIKKNWSNPKKWN